ncbi:hypothetical protein [Streptomyces sp. WAC 06783]|uniref:hypothetical protein n=1 Tax=Streptomyces sp. WAC 06783 TaxID=2203211 RepID=UPI00163BE471|nr:hypothetical protein [Streptomyces sp. WAC 06783]
MTSGARIAMSARPRALAPALLILVALTDPLDRHGARRGRPVLIRTGTLGARP